MTNIDPAIMEACALPAGSKPTLAEAVARLIDAARAEAWDEGCAAAVSALTRGGIPARGNPYRKATP